MSTCPDSDCKKKLNELAEYTWGTKPGSGLMGIINELKGCISKKVPKAWLLWFVVVFGAAGIGGGYKLYHKVEAGDLKYVKKECIAYIELQRQVLENYHRGDLVTKEFELVTQQLEQMNKRFEDVGRSIDRLHKKVDKL